MSVNTSNIENSPPKEFVPNAQMTTKVVKGSFWTLLGQVLPLGISLLSTPFVIRLLGVEQYGIWILILLVPSYFTFADFGMSLASTKFGAEAFGAGDREKEAKIIRTAALISLLLSLPVALILIIFSFPIISQLLNVPESFQIEASFALKIIAVNFVFAILSAVFNTPQLTRLRMDLNALIGASGRFASALALPLVLYYGGGISGAAFVVLIISILTLLAHIFVSGKLLNNLFAFSIDRNLYKPLMTFGRALIFTSIAAVLLVNLEKLFLVRMISVQSLAYYSVAFTFANMAAMFSGSMVQSLIPAFSQLLTPEKREEFNQLFSRCVRLSIICVLPLITILFVVAKPFFTVYAGEDFGRESSFPFYILLAGLLFNVIAFIPQSTLLAVGETKILAWVYWIELPFYILTLIVLITFFGAMGAAAAWSFRCITDAFILIWLSKKKVGLSFSFLKELNKILLSFLVLLPVVVYTLIYENYFLWSIILTLFCLSFYSLLTWRFFINGDEKYWITNQVNNKIGNLFK